MMMQNARIMCPLRLCTTTWPKRGAIFLEIKAAARPACRVNSWLWPSALGAYPVLLLDVSFLVLGTWPPTAAGCCGAGSEATCIGVTDFDDAIFSGVADACKIHT
jgi:hypothetical protein